MIYDNDLEWRIRRRVAEIQAFLGTAECTDEVAAQLEQSLAAAVNMLEEAKKQVREMR